MIKRCPVAEHPANTNHSKFLLANAGSSNCAAKRNASEDTVTQPEDKTINQHKALSGLGLPEIEEFVSKLGLPSFRAKQIHSWIYSKYAGSFDEITELSQD